MSTAALLLLFGLTTGAAAHGVSRYADDFRTAAGLSSLDGTTVDEAAHSLRLAGAAGVAGPPFVSTGSAITQSIVPSSVVSWRDFRYTGSLPPGTSIRVQVLDSANVVFPDSVLPGNGDGFESSRLDLRRLPVLITAGAGKPLKLRFRIILSTTDPSVTPAVDGIELSYDASSAVRPTAAPLAASGWPIRTVTLQATNHTENVPPREYFVPRWTSSDLPGLFPRAVLFQDRLVVNTWLGDAAAYGLDRHTGAVLWRTPYEAWGELTVSGDGTTFGTDIGTDVMVAMDSRSGQLRWTRDFEGGHGNSHVALGRDGTVYTLRQQQLVCDAAACESDTVSLLALDPVTGKVAWTGEIREEGSWLRPSELSLGTDGTLYMWTATADLVTHQLTNQGRVYALNASDGSVLWTRVVGDYASTRPPAIASDGAIYLSQYGWPSQPQFDWKTIALEPDGSLRWERASDAGTTGWYASSVLSDDSIVAMSSSSTTLRFQRIGGADASLLGSYEEPTSAEASADLFSDGRDSLYLTYGSTIRHRGTDFHSRWSFTGPSSYVDGDVYASRSFQATLLDEQGWLYSAFGSGEYDTARGSWLPGQHVVVVAFAPWTMSVALAGPVKVRPGAEVRVNVTTSMPPTNPFTGGANQVQVVTDDGASFPLRYGHTEGQGETVWIGSFTVPRTAAEGSHAFRVEANGDGIETDTAVHFESPAAQSGNTGLAIEGWYRVTAGPSGWR